MNKSPVSIVSDGPTTIEYVYRESAIKVDTSHWNSTDVITIEGAGRVVVDIKFSLVVTSGVAGISKWQNSRYFNYQQHM